MQMVPYALSLAVFREACAAPSELGGAYSDVTRPQQWAGGQAKCLLKFVMAGLVPAIHAFFRFETAKAWMPATSAGMTSSINA
jgi:hypothetical protein